MHTGKGCTAFDLLPPASGVRGAERRSEANERPWMAGTLPGPCWRGGHGVAGCTRLRHAPEPLRRLGQDRATAGLCGRCNERWLMLGCGVMDPGLGSVPEGGL